MKPSASKTMFLGLGLFFLCWACANQRIDRRHAYHFSKTFAKEYDVVWNALEEVIVEKLNYPIRVKDKERGVIETDWISVIRIRGTLRWSVRVLLEKKDNGILVKVYERVEEPTPDIRGKLKNKRGEMKTGWQVSEEKIADVDNILNMLSVRIGE